MPVKNNIILYLFVLILLGCQPNRPLEAPPAQKSAMQYYAAALNAFENDEMQLATVQIDSAIMVRPNFALFYYTKGKFFEQMAENDSAINSYEQAIIKKSHYPDAWGKLLHLYREQGNYQEAIRMLNNLILYYPDSLALEVKIAENFLLDHKPRLALARIHSYENRGGVSSEARRIKGIAKYDIGNLNEALDELAPLLENGENNFLALKSAGLAYYNLGQLENGLNYLNRALSVQPNDAEIYLYRSRYFEARQKPDIALEQIKYAELLDSSDVNIQIQYAKLELNQSDTLAAKNRLQKFAGRHTKCWECYKYLGIIAENNGKIEEALINYRKYLDNIIHRDIKVEQRVKNLGSK